jgi:hypothetical protein
MWVRIGTSDHKMMGSAGIAAQLAASRQGLSSMKIDDGQYAHNM